MHQTTYLFTRKFRFLQKIFPAKIERRWMENEERRELYSGSTMILFTLTRFFQQVISCFVNQVWSAGPGVGRSQDGEAGAVGGGG